MHFAGQLSPEEFWDRVDAAEQSLRESAAESTAYTVADWNGPALIGEWMYRNGPRALVHGDPDDLSGREADTGGQRVIVRTGDNSPRGGVHLARMNAGSGPEPETEAQRAARSSALDTPPDDIAEILVEHTPMIVEVWREGAVWWAGGVHGDDVIVVEGRSVDVDAVTLRPIDDVEPYIAERRAWIARMRGEA